MILIIVIVIKLLDLFQKNLVRLKLKLHFNQDLVQEWLQPYTDKTLESYPKRVSKMFLRCPGFASDCVETLEEIKIR